MRRRSTSTNLVCVSQFIAEVLDASGQVDVVYTDFSKAFDSISHIILINKLMSFGFSGPLIGLFASYLSGRSLAVKKIV